jgi:hypothetical protein
VVERVVYSLLSSRNRSLLFTDLETKPMQVEFLILKGRFAVPFLAKSANNLIKPKQTTVKTRQKM